MEENIKETLKNNEEKYNNNITNTINEKIASQINEILEKNNIKYEQLVEVLNEKLETQFNDQKAYIDKENQDLDNKYESLIKEIYAVLDKNNIKHAELADAINKKLAYNTIANTESRIYRHTSNDKSVSNDKLINYIERIDEDNHKNKKRIKKLEDKQIENDRNIKKIDKKASNAAIISVSIFVIIIIIFLAYQLL